MSFCTVNVQNDTGACAGYLPIWRQKDRLHVTLYGKRTYCNPAAEGANPVIKRMHSMSFCTFTVQNTLFAPVQNVCAPHMHGIACWKACALTFPLPPNKIVSARHPYACPLFGDGCMVVEYCLGFPVCLSIIFLVSCVPVQHFFGFLYACPAFFLVSCFWFPVCTVWGFCRRFRQRFGGIIFCPLILSFLCCRAKTPAHYFFLVSCRILLLSSVEAWLR